jgi:hypothetical protein
MEHRSNHTEKENVKYLVKNLLQSLGPCGEASD